LLIIMILGTIVFPRANRRIWLRRLKLKRKEIVAAIELLAASFDTSEMFRDFRSTNSTLTSKSLDKRANLPRIWTDYDNFQKSLSLYRQTLLEARVFASIGSDDEMHARVGNVVKSLRTKTIAVLGEYCKEFGEEPADKKARARQNEIFNILASPRNLYRKWVERLRFVEGLNQQGLRKPTTDRVHEYDSDLDGLILSAKNIRRSFVALLKVDEYMGAFYNGNDTTRPVSSKNRDIAHEIVLNAGWAWRMDENSRAAEMARKAENLCEDYIGSLHSAFGPLKN
ncbi:hypothetical protein LCGC14_2253040, partial [marine sediment metagenome]